MKTLAGRNEKPKRNDHLQFTNPIVIVLNEVILQVPYLKQVSLSRLPKHQAKQVKQANQVNPTKRHPAPKPPTATRSMVLPTEIPS
jgi:hypothetical protein